MFKRSYSLVIHSPLLSKTRAHLLQESDTLEEQRAQKSKSHYSWYGTKRLDTTVHFFEIRQRYTPGGEDTEDQRTTKDVHGEHCHCRFMKLWSNPNVLDTYPEASRASVRGKPPDDPWWKQDCAHHHYSPYVPPRPIQHKDMWEQRETLGSWYYIKQPWVEEIRQIASKYDLHGDDGQADHDDGIIRGKKERIMPCSTN